MPPPELAFTFLPMASFAAALATGLTSGSSPRDSLSACSQARYVPTCGLSSSTLAVARASRSLASPSGLTRLA